jgi:hypothetical protein
VNGIGGSIEMVNGDLMRSIEENLQLFADSKFRAMEFQLEAIESALGVLAKFFGVKPSLYLIHTTNLGTECHFQISSLSLFNVSIEGSFGLYNSKSQNDFSCHVLLFIDDSRVFLRRNLQKGSVLHLKHEVNSNKEYEIHALWESDSYGEWLEIEAWHEEDNTQIKRTWDI